MIEKELAPEFIQKHESCVMTNYGVAAQYFGCINKIEEIFDAYCDVFNYLPFPVNTEEYSAIHINYVCPKLNWHGYQMIDLLHNNSVNSVFNKCRDTFSIEILDPDRFSEIEAILKKDTVAVIANIVSDKHSFTLYAFQKKFIAYCSGVDPRSFEIVNITGDTLTLKAKPGLPDLELPYSECILYSKK